MKFLGETSLKKLISLIKGEIATKQNKITTNGILQCDGDGNISAASLDKNSVGLGNVGNFKAVSTAASQGLTATEKTNARTNIGAGTGTYSKPLTGIPKTDFASAVQASLDKADTALQSHQDISGKVDKVTGKGLSTNDFTTDEKNKLAGIATGANKTTVDSALSDSSTNPVQNKVINNALSGKANSSHTHKASDITSGVIPLDYGGTGSNVSLRDAPNGAIIRKLKDDNDNELWYTPTKNGALYAKSENGVPSFGTLPIAQGGTGATSAAKARENLGAASSSHTHGAGDITGTLGIAHGGTGATTAAAARTNLDITPANIGAAPSSHNHSYLPLSGGTLTGNVTISKNNPWIRLQNGDHLGYFQLSGSTMAIGSTWDNSLKIDSAGCLILTSAMYGTTLPAAGKKGRIFFKKV